MSADGFLAAATSQEALDYRFGLLVREAVDADQDEVIVTRAREAAAAYRRRAHELETSGGAR